MASLDGRALRPAHTFPGRPHGHDGGAHIISEFLVISIAYSFLPQHFVYEIQKTGYNARIVPSRLQKKAAAWVDRPASFSRWAEARAAGRARKAQNAALRGASLELLTSGFTREQIAEARNTSVARERWEIDWAIVERRLDAPDRCVHLDVARLTKALRLLDLRIERGELRAVAPFVKIVAALDRYHGLGGRSKAAPAAPPLELTRAIPPELAKRTDFGA